MFSLFSGKNEYKKIYRGDKKAIENINKTTQENQGKNYNKPSDSKWNGWLCFRIYDWWT